MRFWRRVPSLTPLIFLLAGVASGCTERLWDPGYMVVAPDGGVVDARTDGAAPKKCGCSMMNFPT